jgi:hypothetical protein
MQTAEVMRVFKPNTLKDLNAGNNEIDFVPALSLSSL